MSNPTKKKASDVVIALDSLVVRNSATETIRRVRQAQADKRAAAEAPVMSLLLPSSDDFNFSDLVDLDESDPLLAQLIANPAGSITLGDTNESGAHEKNSSSDDDSDDDDYKRLASRKRKQDQESTTSKRKPAFTADDEDDSSDDDFRLSTLKTKNSAAVAENDKSDDDFALSDLKRRKTYPSTKKKKKPSTKKHAVIKKVAPKSKSSTATSASKRTKVTTEESAAATGELFSSHDEDEPDVEMSHGTGVITPTLSKEDREEDSDEPLPGLTLEESQMMKLLDGRLVVAEERQAMHMLDNNIVAAEEAAAMHALGECILEAADNMAESSGMVTITAINPTKTIPPAIVDLEREWDIFEQKELFVGPTGMLNTVAKLISEKRSGILDLDNMGHGELHVTKKLPKFINGGSEMLVTEEELEKTVVAKLRQEASADADNFAITVSDKKGDLSTIILEMRGQKRVIDKAKVYLQLLIRAKQLRFIPLQAKLRGALNVSETRKMHEARALVHYKRFEKKTAKIRDIEFSDIHACSVWSSMWKVHKHKYGNVCNPPCRCVTDLHHLTSSVVSDQKRKKLKAGETFKPPIEVGFCSRFAPKFMPLLRKEFPHETNEEIFERLLLMWDRHKMQRRFGVACREDCSCAEGWSSVFQKGVSTSKKMGVSDSKKHAVSTSSASPAKKEFEIIFDTRQQMGFFCVTRKHQKHDVCKILSVNSLGAAKDSRLHPETIVTAVAIGNSPEWVKVNSHEDLKRHYDSCKKYGGVNIRVRFINTDVMLYNSRDRDETLWTQWYQWDGKSKYVGWAGGAIPSVDIRAKLREASLSMPASSGAGTAAPTNVPPWTQAARTVSQAHDSDQCDKSRREVSQSHSRAGWQSAKLVEPTPTTGMSKEPRKSQPRHHGSTQPLSIFDKKSSKPKADKVETSMFRNLSNSIKKPNAALVKWRNANELRYYDPKDMSYDEREESDEKVTNNNDAKVVQRAAAVKSGNSALQKQLLAAISHKTCVDVFALLKSGAAPKPANVEPKNRPEVCAKRIRESLENELQRNPGIASKHKLSDAQMKVALIKIFDRAQDVMDNCRCLKKWGRFEFKIDRVENLTLKPAASPSNDDKFQCSVAMREELLGNTPWVKLSSSMTWSESEAKRFGFKHNSSLPDRNGNNNVEFKLRKVGGPSVEQVDLASETRSMTEIGKAAALATFNLDVAATDLLQSARVIISVQKLERESKKRIDEKRKVYQKELGRLICDIEQFNSDENRKLTGMHKLDFDLQHNTTMLHSAVYLNDVDLVRKLVAHGADKHVRDRSASMTPEMLAMSEIMVVRRTPSETQSYEIEKLQKILKLLGYTGTFDDDDIAFSPTDDEQPIEGTAVAVVTNRETSVRPTLLRPMSDTGAKTHAKDAPLSSQKKNRNLLDGEANVSRKDLGKRLTRGNGPSAKPQDELGVSTIENDERKPNSMANEAPSSRKRSRSPEGRPLQIAKTPRRESYNKYDLPAMTMEQLTDGTRLCTYFNSKKGCKRGIDCHFVHLERVDPTGIDFGSERASYNRARDVRLKKAVDRNGRTLFTAMYKDTTQNTYLKARGGATLGANLHGIFWYESEVDAIEAIERVITLWENPELERTSPNDRSSSTAFKFEPPPLLTRQDSAVPSQFQPAQSRAPDASRSTLRQTPQASTPSVPSPHATHADRTMQPSAMTAEERDVFNALKCANLSNTVVKILKQPLTHSEWTFSSFPQDGIPGVHVSFSKSIANNLPKQSFQSMGHGQDCRYVNGKWYHNDLRGAKASAFLEFLKFCKKIGMLWSLTQTMTNMEDLPFWKRRQLS
jgi:hypothetical protein